MQNFFQLFSLEERFDINLDQLDARYFELQSKHHPDQAYSDVNTAILLNQGYNILKDNFERASHILELHGIFIKDDKLAPKLPPEMLEGILEMREGGGEANYSAILSSIKAAFLANDYQAAALKVLEMRFLEKIMQ